jgi:DNA-binding FrmR family transcriptional regulator
VAHTIRDKKKLLTRLRRIGGQVVALQRDIDAEKGCAEVLQQIAAIRGAVNGLMAEVMEGHLREHISARRGSHSEEAEQVISMVRAYLK